MPSETFYCPHCKRQLTKTAQHYVMGESSYFIGLGGLPPNVSCLGCGGSIDSIKIIKGEYDNKNLSRGCASGFVIFIIIFLAVVFKSNL